MRTVKIHGATIKKYLRDTLPDEILNCWWLDTDLIVEVLDRRTAEIDICRIAASYIGNDFNVSNIHITNWQNQPANGDTLSDAEFMEQLKNQQK